MNKTKVRIETISFIFIFLISLSAQAVETEVRKTYYGNGQIKSKASYIKDTNIKHGEVIAYHKNGNITGKVTFKEGERVN